MALRPTLLIVLLAVMLSTAARAFGTKAPSFIRSSPRSFAVARGMSSTSEPDTSVVDTCQKKIQAALEADNVKVTGKSDSTVLDFEGLLLF